MCRVLVIVICKHGNGHDGGDKLVPLTNSSGLVTVE